MAQYHLYQRPVQRSHGESAVGTAAYISGEKLYDSRLGKVHDYATKSEVVAKKILLPEKAPEWAKDAETLWNRVEAFEDELAYQRYRGHRDPLKQAKSLKKRDDVLQQAQPALKLEGALPVELTLEQSQEALETFLHERFVSRGLAAHYAIHGEAGNPHFHAIITQRAFQGDTFHTTKDRALCSRSYLKGTRQAWEHIGNEALAKVGRLERWTCESYKTLGLKVKPTQHLGPYGDSLERQDLPCRISQENAEAALDNMRLFLEEPEQLIKLVSLQKTVFTRSDIERELLKRMGGHMELVELLHDQLESLLLTVSEEEASNPSRMVGRFVDHILAHAEVVSLGDNVNRERVFVRRDDQEREANVMMHVTTLLESTGAACSPKKLHKAIQKVEKEQGFTYAEPQKAAMYHLASDKQITVLTGRAGTGKTTLLKPLVRAYEASGYRVRGTAFQGKIVDMLGRDLGIRGSTLDALNKTFERLEEIEALLASKTLRGKARLKIQEEWLSRKRHDLTHRDVLILDEANMVSLSHWEKLLPRLQQKGAKLIVVQDPAQIKALQGADISRVLEAQGKPAVLSDVFRQHHPWMKEASLLLNAHQVEAGLKAYAQRGHVHFKDPQTLKDSMVSDYITALLSAPDKTMKILAYRNHDVQAFNEAVQSQLKERGQLGREIIIGAQTFYEGDHIMFTQNEWGEKVVNSPGPSLAERLRQEGLKGLYQWLNPPMKRGVKNGTFGILRVLKDGQVRIELSDQRWVSFKPEIYDHLTLAYALTINKAEGETFDHVLAYGDVKLSPNHWLILGTRHREALIIYINQQQAPTLAHVIQQTANSDYRLLISDYNVPESKKPFFDQVQTYRDVCLALSRLRSAVHKHDESASTPPKADPRREEITQLETQRKDLALQILESWKDCEPYIRQTGIKRVWLEYYGGLRDKPLTPLDREARDRVGLYRSACLETRSLWQNIQTSYSEDILQERTPHTHPLYAAYLHAKQTRDHLAEKIASQAALHRPFFKLTRQEDKGRIVYVDQTGRIYDQPVYGLRTAQKHALGYRQTLEDQQFLENLSPLKKQRYETLLNYRQSVRDVAITYKHLQALKDQGQEREALKPLSLSLERRVERRDLTAYTIVLQLPSHQPFHKRLKISEDKLLHHATLGELRHRTRLYHQASTPFERQTQAQRLDQILRQEEQPLSQSYLALSRRLGLDLKQVSFEAGKNLDPSSPQASYPVLQRTGQEERNRFDSSRYPHRSQDLQRLLDRIHETVDMKTLAFDVLKGRDTPYQPTLSKGATLRFGQKGSLAITLAGAHKNTWKSFETDDKGNALSFLETYSPISGFKERLTFIRPYVNEDVRYDIDAFLTPSHAFQIPNRPVISRPQAVTSSVTAQHAQEATRLQKLEEVKALYLLTSPLAGTQGETYLRQQRGLTCELSDDVRYLKLQTTFIYQGKERTVKQGALAAIARNETGEIQAIQLTYLDGHGRRALDREGNKFAKVSFGSLTGASVMLTQPTQASQVTYISEGIETGLSLKQTGLSAPLMASLGQSNLVHSPLSTPRAVLLGDYDGKNHDKTSERLAKIQRTLEEKGHQVYILWPTLQGPHKVDFNDILLQDGSHKLQSLLGSIPHDFQETPPSSDSLKKETSSSFDSLGHKQHQPSSSAIKKEKSENTFQDHQTAPVQRINSPASSEKAFSSNPSLSCEPTRVLERLQAIQETYGLEKDMSKRSALFKEMTGLMDTLPSEALQMLENDFFKQNISKDHSKLSESLSVGISFRDKQNLEKLYELKEQYAHETNISYREQLFQQVNSLLNTLSSPALQQLTLQEHHTSQQQYVQRLESLHEQLQKTSSLSQKLEIHQQINNLLKNLDEAYKVQVHSSSLKQETPLETIERLTTQLSTTPDSFKRDALMSQLESTIYDLEGPSLKAFEANNVLQEKLEKEAPHLSRSQSIGMNF